MKTNEKFDAIRDKFYHKNKLGSADNPIPVGLLDECQRSYNEMLEALKHIIAMHDDDYLVGHPEWNVIVDEVRAAIAKAEGKEGQ